MEFKTLEQGLKKYVIGKENLPITGKFNKPFNGESSMNTYQMRYAELLLIHAASSYRFSDRKHHRCIGS